MTGKAIRGPVGHIASVESCSAVGKFGGSPHASVRTSVIAGKIDATDSWWDDVSDLAQAASRAVFELGSDAWSVHRAWSLAKERYVADAIKQRAGKDFHALVSGILPGLLVALGVYLLSVVLGTLVGAGVGALAGGVGAGPGAAVGASVGSTVGIWILNFIGVGFLLVYLGENIGEFGSKLVSGIERAWDSDGNRGEIDAAAQEMADAVGIFFSLLAQAIIAFAAKEGISKAGTRLSKTKFGKGIVGWLEKNRWAIEVKRALNEVLVDPKANAGKQSRVRTAVKFLYEKRNQIDEFGGGLDQGKRDSYLKAMDFSKEVTEITLKPGDKLTAFASTSKEAVGNFYTLAGRSPERLGIDSAGRQFVIKEVTTPVIVLKSYTAGLGTRNEIAAGKFLNAGDVQIIVPSPKSVLKEIYRSPKTKP